MIAKKPNRPLCVKNLQADVAKLERSLTAARSQIAQLQTELYTIATVVQSLRRESFRTKEAIVHRLRVAYRHSLNAFNNLK